MKTRPDKTIPAIIVAYGLIFVLPFFINFNITTFSLSWMISWILVILFGVWKIETFEIEANKLTKTNFMGLFRRTISLDSIIYYDKREIDTNYNRNLFNIVRFFSKNKKYLIFRQIIITTENGTKMKLDERTIYTEDFKILYNKIGSRKRR